VRQFWGEKMFGVDSLEKLRQAAPKSVPPNEKAGNFTVSCQE
jgi:hypothetical protein